MKGLDTPILLGILHGTPASRRLLKLLQGEELATTELNMFELYHVATQGSRAARQSRQRALAALRRRISVLPITAAAADEVTRGGSTRPMVGGYGPLIWGALMAAGCGEWITTKEAAPPRGATKLKCRVI